MLYLAQGLVNTFYNYLLNIFSSLFVYIICIYIFPNVTLNIKISCVAKTH